MKKQPSVVEQKIIFREAQKQDLIFIVSISHKLSNPETSKMHPALSLLNSNYISVVRVWFYISDFLIKIFCWDKKHNQAKVEKGSQFIEDRSVVDIWLILGLVN